MRLCGHCGKALVNEKGNAVYNRYFCSPDTCGKADRAERMAAKRAKEKGEMERRIERAIRAHCKQCPSTVRVAELEECARRDAFQIAALKSAIETMKRQVKDGRELRVVGE